MRKISAFIVLNSCTYDWEEKNNNLDHQICHEHVKYNTDMGNPNAYHCLIIGVRENAIFKCVF